MNPITRKETFLAKAGGQDVTTPTPVTREEYFLNEIAKGSGGGSGGGGVLVVGVTVDGNTATLDKTWQEIVDADLAVLKVQNDSMLIETLHGYGITERTYWVHFGGPDGELPEFYASSADGYPSTPMG